MKKKMMLFIFIVFINCVFVKSALALSTFDCVYYNLDTPLKTVKNDGKTSAYYYNPYVLSFTVGTDGIPIMNQCFYAPDNDKGDYAGLILYKDGEGTILDSKYNGITEGKHDCSDAKFNPDGNKLNDESDCPSSINVIKWENNSVKEIIWVTDKKGEYKLAKKDNYSFSANPCNEYKKEDKCRTAKGISCLWVEKELNGKTYEYCNVDDLLYVSCGDARDIPIQVPALISFAVNFLKIITPLILIFTGVLTLVKAIAASKEDEIKKAQGSLVKKIIASVLVFFVITIVQYVMSLVADNEYASEVNEKTEKTNLSDCLKCFLNNDCEDSAYYKTVIANKDHCTYLKPTEELKNGLCPGQVE